MLKGIVILCLIVNALMSIGQSNSIDDFNEAKRMMFNQQFDSAISAFQSLKTNPQLVYMLIFFKGCATARELTIKRLLKIGR